MSAGPIGTIGSLATGQLHQARSADADRAAQDTNRHIRAADAMRRAEDAAGIGEMQQEGAASERDADGRRLWEMPPRPTCQKRGKEPAEAAVPCSRDASGDSGSQLDLSG